MEDLQRNLEGIVNSQQKDNFTTIVWSLKGKDLELNAQELAEMQA